MQPGFRQKLDSSRTWSVQFDRGGSFGQAQYTLVGGTYEWVITVQGWDLKQRTFQVTVDNTANANDFNYVLGDQQDVVLGGQSKSITGKFPVVLTFDRGDGKEPVKKELLDGTYRVGIDVASNLMDLFPGSAPMLADASEPSAVRRRPRRQRRLASTTAGPAVGPSADHDRGHCRGRRRATRSACRFHEAAGSGRARKNPIESVAGAEQRGEG